MPLISRRDAQYYFPIFSTYRNGVPVSAQTGIWEAAHIFELYECYGGKHNDHPSLYADYSSDPLERRLFQSPEVEVVSWNHSDLQYYVGLRTNYALSGAYTLARQGLGDALQPAAWNRCDPWRPYDFASELAKLGMPYIPEPESFYDGIYHLPFDSLGELQRVAHRNNFYALCLFALIPVIDAVKMNHYSNVVPAGYMRGSAGLTSAERYWHRIRGFPVTDVSEDDDSAAGKSSYSRYLQPLSMLSSYPDFELALQEQQESADALIASPEPDEIPVARQEAPAQDCDPNTDNHAFSRDPDRAELLAFVVANPELLRGLRQRWNNIGTISNESNAGSPPVVSPCVLNVDLYDLIGRLEAISTRQDSPEPSASGADENGSEWEWSTPAPANAPSLGSPGWSSTTQQTTQALSWEEFWSDCINTSERMEIGGSLTDHVITTFPSAAN